MRSTQRTLLLTIVTLGLPLVILHPALAADTAGVSQINSFIRSIIQILAGIAGLLATGFFVVGGFGYITSSGNPENLSRSKRTIMFSALGLAVTIGAFVLSTIVTDLATKAFGN
jgi:hypothetical protein